MIDAQSYFESGVSHSSTALDLYYAGSFQLSFYVAGLSVECIFRALIARSSLQFDEMHDLKKLSDSSKFIANVPVSRTFELAGNLEQVYTLWSNVHRFRSEKAMRRFLKNRQFDRGIKGDFLKENCRRIVNAADAIVKEGIVQWTK